MLYREIPKTGDKLSALGFGCMRFPVHDSDMTKIDEKKSIEMMRYAIDNGVNYIDTAYPYHGTGMGSAGMSEPFVGRVLKDVYREKVKLATKLPGWLVQNREDMDKILNHQLERLQTESIDYYLIHSLNSGLWTNVKQKSVFDFLDQAIRDGRIKNAGFSFHDNSLELFKEIVDAYDWTFCQIQYNYLDEYYQAGKEGLKYAADKGLGVVIMEPLKGGSLATNLPNDVMNVFHANDPGKSPAEWSLRWLWNQPEVSTVLSGMSAMEHVIENVRIAKDAPVGSMSEADLKIVEKVKSTFKSNVQVGCTACGYCMPCPVGVNIPQNFTYLNDFHRFEAAVTKLNTKVMYNTVLNDKEKANACIECGDCEDHCPQEIPIREKLKEVHETLGT